MECQEVCKIKCLLPSKMPIAGFYAYLVLPSYMLSINKIRVRMPRNRGRLGLGKILFVRKKRGT